MITQTTIIAAKHVLLLTVGLLNICDFKAIKTGLIDTCLHPLLILHIYMLNFHVNSVDACMLSWVTEY